MRIHNSYCTVDPLLNQTSCDYITYHCDSKFFFVARAYYCSTNASLWRALCYSVGLLVLIGIIVMILGLIVSNYLLYCVTNFTDLFGINHKVLSFFIIPLTNSLPDLLNYHVAIKDDSVDLVLGQVIGANLMSFTIVMGLICYICPFFVDENKIIVYGLVWALLMISILAYVMSDSKVNLLECSLMCILYFIYAWGLYFLNIQEATEDAGMETGVTNKPNILDEHSFLISHPIFENHENTDLCPNSSLFERLMDVVDCLLFVFIPVSRPTLQRLQRIDSPFRSALFSSKIFHLWLVFVSCVLLNLSTFRLKANYIACVIATFYVTFEIVRRYADETCCNVLADVVSICNSLAFLSCITKALIQLLKNLGVIWKISEYSMGLLVFSIVNSINDIVMNILLSTKLSPTLGVSSCLGTSFILILFGIGFNGFVRLATRASNCETHGALCFNLSSEIYISTASLIAIVLLYILYLPLNQWKFDQRIGIFGIFVWVATTVSCLIMDFKMND